MSADSVNTIKKTFSSKQGPIHFAGRITPARRLAILLTLLPCCSFFLSCVSTHKNSANGNRFTDEINRTVVISSELKRIISLAPSVTETLFALGVGDRVVGVTTFCDYPPEAIEKEKVGDTTRPNLERITALRPDLVIVSTASQLEQFIAKLEDLNIPVYVSNPRNVEGVLQSIGTLGEIFGAQARARELVAGLRSRVQAIEAQVKNVDPKAVFFILSSEPLFTIGGGTFIDDLINRAGGRSISANEAGDYPQYSLESALARNPEVIFLASGADLPARLSQTKAAQAGRVYRLDDNLLLRPGPRIVDGLEQMAERIVGSRR